MLLMKKKGGDCLNNRLNVQLQMVFNISKLSLRLEWCYRPTLTPAAPVPAVAFAHSVPKLQHVCASCQAEGKKDLGITGHAVANVPLPVLVSTQLRVEVKGSYIDVRDT